ncbi:MAG: FAD binding domain-containing protein [Planctomycetota bacterium]
MERFTLVQPRSMTEAASELTKGGAAMAGGVDLLDRMKEGAAKPERVVSLDFAPRNTVWLNNESLELDANCTLEQVARSDRIRKELPALARAAGDAATPQIRNVATLGGNLLQEPRCWYYRLSDFSCWRKGGEGCPALEGDNRYHAILGDRKCPAVHASSLAPALVALGAQVEIEGRTDTPPVESLWPAPGEEGPFTTLALGQILTKVIVPSGHPSAYVEVRHRQSFDWALASAAVARTAVGGWRVVLGAVAPVPWRSPEAEKALGDGNPDAARIAKAADAALATAKPLSMNAYKVKLARTALTRALTEAAGG